jgi:UDP-N-acetylenolpyruvoylglucosamine reductase
VAIPAEAPELMVNLGGGTARDLGLLQRSVLDRIQRERGVTLESRMHFRGGTE